MFSLISINKSNLQAEEDHTINVSELSVTSKINNPENQESTTDASKLNKMDMLRAEEEKLEIEKSIEIKSKNVGVDDEYKKKKN